MNMNPENERDSHHCDCGRPKAPGESMCRPCAVGGFPPDDGEQRVWNMDQMCDQLSD